MVTEQGTGTGTASALGSKLPGDFQMARGIPAVKRVSLDSFFFQAEDGIRDYKVTGVQTCALPIYISPIAAFRIRYLLVSGAGITSSDTVDSRSRPVRNYWKILLARGTARTVEGRPEEIGRASCRERV